MIETNYMIVSSQVFQYLTDRLGLRPVESLRNKHENMMFNAGSTA